jgi:ABC-type nitrate/sulfonate/bicarbonate transport system substrate-binding protein
LSGKRIGLVRSQRLEAVARSIVAADDGDPDSLEFIGTGSYEPNITDVIAGRFDAVVNIGAWESLLGGLPPEERSVFGPFEWGGLIYPSYVWAARKPWIERNPVLVRLFVEAVNRGYQLAISSPERAVEALQKALLNYHPDLIKESLSLVTPTWTVDGRWGYQDPEVFENYAQWLAGHGLIGSTDSLDGAFINDYLPTQDAVV